MDMFSPAPFALSPRGIAAVSAHTLISNYFFVCYTPVEALLVFRAR